MNIKVFALLSILTALFLLIGLYFGGIAGAGLGLIIAFITNFISYWYSDKIVLRMYNAKRAREKDYPDIANSLKKLVKDADIPQPKLYIINSNAPNAFATGRDPEHASIAITKGLMQNLSVEEVEGVLSHELSHIKHRDTLINAIAVTLGGAITWLAYIFYFGDRRNRSPLSFILLFVLAPLAAVLVRLAISRSREYFADKEGAEISSPLNLASALQKIEKQAKQANLKGNPVTSSLFIINPFKSATLSSLFSTHPPTSKRIARLRQMSV